MLYLIFVSLYVIYIYSVYCIVYILRSYFLLSSLFNLCFSCLTCFKLKFLTSFLRGRCDFWHCYLEIDDSRNDTIHRYDYTHTHACTHVCQVYL